jgi:5-methylcytosine-specific restriction endonuclease McrA
MDHNPENLELLCPNCHSLTKNYKGSNKGQGRQWRREKREKMKKEKGYCF